jgi:hypothetical protein
VADGGRRLGESQARHGEFCKVGWGRDQRERGCTMPAKDPFEPLNLALANTSAGWSAMASEILTSVPEAVKLSGQRKLSAGSATDRIV